MKKILLLLVMTISMVCHAKEPCINKTSVRDYQFNINNQLYKFTSYFCEDEDEDQDRVFPYPAILEIHGKNFNKTLKNVIGMAGKIGVMFSNWDDKNTPVFHYTFKSPKNVEAYIPMIIDDNNVMVECSYMDKTLTTGIKIKYSYCGDLQIVQDGFGEVEEGFDNLLPEFYLELIYDFSDFNENKKSLKYKNFDVFIGKIDDISFYRRYSSIKDYKLNKYMVVIVNKEKQYQFKQQDEIYQRMGNPFIPERFIGLDIVDSKGNIKFYDKNALSALLNESPIKRNIKSYIQNDKKTQLYNQPDDNSATNIYLVKHDFVTILDEILNEYQDDILWYKISYKSEEHGNITKWIKGKPFTSNLD